MPVADGTVVHNDPIQDPVLAQIHAENKHYRKITGEPLYSHVIDDGQGHVTVYFTDGAEKSGYTQGLAYLIHKRREAEEAAGLATPDSQTGSCQTGTGGDGPDPTGGDRPLPP